MNVKNQGHHRGFGRRVACSVAMVATAIYCHGALGPRAAGAAQIDRARAVCLAWDPGTSQGCPSVGEIEAAVGAMLSRPVASPGTCRTRVSGSFHSNADGGWRVELHFASETGESLGNRSLEIRDAGCGALREPLSLIIALMVEGNAAESAALRLPKPSSAQRDEGGAGTPATMSAGAAVSSGLLPDVGFGATLGFASRAVAGLPLRLDTTFWFPTVKTRAGLGGQFWALVGGVGFCPSFFQSKSFRAAVCLRMVAGVIRGAGFGLNDPDTATRPVGEGEVNLTVSLQFSRQAALYLSAGVAAPWIRSRFVYRVPPDDVRVQVYEPSALIPLAGLGLEFGSQGTHSRAAKP